MNTRSEAKKNVRQFIKSDQEKVLIIKGTHQYEKHKLVLRLINEEKESPKILFRTNRIDNLGTQLETRDENYKTGTAYKAGKGLVYFDSINIVTWKNTPHDLDFAVVYPIDSISKSNLQEKVLDDLLQFRNVNKIFLVTWTDNVSFDWAEDIADRQVTFDAEEEDPEYHQRMINLLTKDHF